MQIQEAELYHGAALTQIAEHEGFTAINKMEDRLPGHFRVNGNKHILIKYARRTYRDRHRVSSWVFGMTTDNCCTLNRDQGTPSAEVFLVLVCAKVGICLLSWEDIGIVLDLSNCSDQYITVKRPEGGGFRVSGDFGERRGVIHINAFPQGLLR